MNRKNTIIIALFIILAAAGSIHARAAQPPENTVSDFYNWYFKNDRVYRQKITEKKALFEPELFDNLVNAFKKGPKDGKWVDFDPFMNAQMNGKSISIRKVIQDNVRASVVVDITLSRRGKSSLKVFLRKHGDSWKIANFIYDRDFNLLDFLKKVNK